MPKRVVELIVCCLGLFVLVMGLKPGSIAQDSAPCVETSGSQERQEYYASAIETRMVYTVYLPPCYDTEASYPTLYLMHGSNDDDGQWGRLGLYALLDERIASGQMPPVLVVLPFANWIGNENRFGRDSWNGVFVEQLMPLVEQDYAVDPARRLIGGISRGGFWAFHIAFRFPEMFLAVGGHSAFFDRYHAAPEYNPLDLALNAAGIERLKITLDRGADDYARPGLDIMDERLRERGLSYTYTVYPQGQHNNDYWRAHVADYLDFYVDALTDAATEAQPTASPVNPVLFVTNTPHPGASDLGLLPTPTPSVATPSVAVPELAVPATERPRERLYLLLPVTVFPSRQTSLPLSRLRDLRAGIVDPKLLVTIDVAATLEREFGVTLPPGTRLVDQAELFNLLNRDRTLYALLPFERLEPRYRVLWLDDLHPLDTDLGQYPFAFETDTPNFDSSLLTRVAMSGVTALTRETIPALDREGLEWAASGIRDYVLWPDFFHTSNEVSIHPDCPAYVPERLGPFCSKAEHFELFDMLDIDIVELSGNHNNDYGYQAYLDTLQWFEDRGIMTTAGGRTVEEAQQPLIIEHNGNRIAFVSCNRAGPYYAWVNENPNATGGVRPGAAECGSEWLRGALGSLAAENDYVILSVQHVEFDQFTPSDAQRADFRTWASWGADAVFGTQSHFPQVFEFASSARPGAQSFLHYGLGNLYFDQEFFGGVRFFIDQLFIYEGRLLTIDLFPGMIERQGRPRLMTPEERENFLFLIFTQYGGM